MRKALQSHRLQGAREASRITLDRHVYAIVRANGMREVVSHPANCADCGSVIAALTPGAQVSTQASFVGDLSHPETVGSDIALKKGERIERYPALCRPCADAEESTAQ